MNLTFKANHLKQLQRAYNDNEMSINYRSANNIFYRLCQAEPRLGVIGKDKIELAPFAWAKILKLVEQSTQINLATVDIKTLSEQNRIENSAVTSDEKLLALAPTKGFLQVRLVVNDNNKPLTGVFNDITPVNSYIGIMADSLSSLTIDNVIIVENFTPFVQMTQADIIRIQGLAQGATLLIYRGHDSQTVYANLEKLKALAIKIYLFPDYDFAGLNLAIQLADKIVADGIILPSLDVPISELRLFNKSKARFNQQPIATDKLTLHYKRLKEEFLAITQESLLYSKVPLAIYT